jgi:hypothetical protein
MEPLDCLHVLRLLQIDVDDRDVGVDRVAQGASAVTATSYSWVSAIDRAWRKAA